MCPLDLYQDPEASDGNAHRDMGEANVLYDILVMVNPTGKARDHILSLGFLLENIRFIVHPGKVITTPTQ